jgi:hypothetical protein
MSSSSGIFSGVAPSVSGGNGSITEGATPEKIPLDELILAALCGRGGKMELFSISSGTTSLQPSATRRSTGNGKQFHFTPSSTQCSQDELVQWGSSVSSQLSLLGRRGMEVGMAPGLQYERPVEG